MLILENKTFEVDTLNNLFAYRFLLIVKHPLIQKQILYNPQYENYFNSIFALYQALGEYRRANEFEDSPPSGVDLKEADEDLYKKFLNRYRATKL